MADNLLFDRLAYIDRLTKAGLDERLARAHAEATTEALRESVATRSDIADLRHEIDLVRHEIALVRQEIQTTVRDMTVRTGGMLVLLFSALVAIRFFGH